MKSQSCRPITLGFRSHRHSQQLPAPPPPGMLGLPPTDDELTLPGMMGLTPTPPRDDGVPTHTPRDDGATPPGMMGSPSPHPGMMDRIAGASDAASSIQLSCDRLSFPRSLQHRPQAHSGSAPSLTASLPPGGVLSSLPLITGLQNNPASFQGPAQPPSLPKPSLSFPALPTSPRALVPCGSS